jgi:hypothetical protein
MNNHKHLLNSIERALPYKPYLISVFVLAITATLHYFYKLVLAFGAFLKNLLSPFTLFTYGAGIAILRISLTLSNHERFFEGAFLLFIWLMVWWAITFTRINREKIILRNRSFA